MKAEISEDRSELNIEFEESGEGTSFVLLLQRGIIESEELLDTSDEDIKEMLENWKDFVWWMGYQDRIDEKEFSKKPMK